MEYQAVVVKRSKTLNRSPESRYWRQFKYPVFFKEYAPITALHFAPSKPHRYAVTAATRVQIYAPRTQKITKTISRFKDVARSGCIREDGKLLVAGDDSGLIQVITSRYQVLVDLQPFSGFRCQFPCNSSHPGFAQATRPCYQVFCLVTRPYLVLF